MRNYIFPLVMYLVAISVRPLYADTQQRSASIAFLPFWNLSKVKNYNWIKESARSAIKKSMNEKFIYQETDPEFVEFSFNKYKNLDRNKISKTAQEIGKKTRSDYVIYGTWDVDNRNIITLQAFLYSIQANKVVKQSLEMTPANSEMFAATDSLANSLIAGIINYVAEQDKKEKVIQLKNIPKVLTNKAVGEQKTPYRKPKSGRFFQADAGFASASGAYGDNDNLESDGYAAAGYIFNLEFGHYNATFDTIGWFINLSGISLSTNEVSLNSAIDTHFNNATSNFEITNNPKFLMLGGGLSWNFFENKKVKYSAKIDLSYALIDDLAASYEYDNKSLEYEKYVQGYANFMLGLSLQLNFCITETFDILFRVGVKGSTIPFTTEYDKESGSAKSDNDIAASSAYFSMGVATYY